MHASLLGQAPLLEDLLPAELLLRLKKLAVRNHYNDGEIVQVRGDTNTGLSFVRAGAVRVGNPGKDGSYLSISVFTEGQTFGELTLFAGLPRTHEIVSVGASVVDEISQNKFMPLFSSEPELARALLAVSLVRTHSLLEFMDDLRRLPLAVHVAKVIFATAAGSAHLVVKQDELAFTFGVSRVSMGKVLKRLASMDLIRLGYGKIEIRDQNHMRQWLSDNALVTPVASEMGQSAV